MVVRCAWCKKILHGELKPTEPVSDGICPECDDAMRAEGGLPPRRPAPLEEK